MRGICHKYGDHIDTDAIIPARYLNDPRRENLAAHCMEDIDADFSKHIRSGDIIVGGINFGCGSSREHAPIALLASGVSCIIANSFARIFFRNAINIGLPVMECPQAVHDAANGDQLEVDLDIGIIKNLTKGASYTVAPFPPFMQKIISVGGLIPYTKTRMEAGK